MDAGDGPPQVPWRLERSWSALVVPAALGSGGALLLLFLLSRLGVSVWLDRVGSGMVADATRELLSTKTFHLTGLMLYGAHFIPIRFIGFTVQTEIPVPGWAHLIPILPLLAGGYLTVVFGREVVGPRVWLGAVIAVPYTIVLLVLISAFSLEINLLVARAYIAPSSAMAVFLLPLWSASLGAVGGVLAGQE